MPSDAARGMLRRVVRIELRSPGSGSSPAMRATLYESANDCESNARGIE